MPFLLKKLLGNSFIRFIIVGTSNFIITVVTFTIIYHISSRYNIASISGFSLSLINSYYLNKNFTFSSNTQSKSVKFKFVAANIFGLLINLLSLNILITKFHLDEILSQIISTIFVMLINYSSFKIIFKTDQADTM